MGEFVEDNNTALRQGPRGQEAGPRFNLDKIELKWDFQAFFTKTVVCCVI